MFYDARRVDDQHVLKCDVCIVGAGAAGIVLAMELSSPGTRVILLEAGGMHRSGKSQKLYEGEVADADRHLPLDSDRYRQFGGTTGLWGGRCIPFDPIDFEKRDYIPHSGWPITCEELEAYYRKAHEYCECGDFEYRAGHALPSENGRMISGLPDGALMTSSLPRISGSWGSP